MYLITRIDVQFSVPGALQEETYTKNFRRRQRKSPFIKMLMISQHIILTKNYDYLNTKMSDLKETKRDLKNPDLKIMSHCDFF